MTHQPNPSTQRRPNIIVLAGKLLLISIIAAIFWIWLTYFYFPMGTKSLAAVATVTTDHATRPPLVTRVTATPSQTPVQTATYTPLPPTATATSMPTTALIMSSTPTQRPAATAKPLPTATQMPPPRLPTPQYGVYSDTVRVPILMYHYISVPPEDADIYRTDLSVAPDVFREQMAYLHDNGYTTIDFYTLSRRIAQQGELPDKPVILTFDDGYLEHYENAFPILQEYGLVATFFIITEFVDFGNPAYMNWEMIEEMSAAGMSMEPHTKTHLNLNEHDRDFQIYQLLGSLQTMEAHIGYRPRFLSYPGGRYDDVTLELMAELDFWGGLTTKGGRWHGFDNRYEWRRMRVRHVTNLPEFITLISP